MKVSAFNIESQSSSGWLDRAEKCAKLISFISSELSNAPTLADVGCGDKKLKEALSAESINFRYQGYDICPQYSDIKKFDANFEELGIHYDVVAALGITEYINLPKFLLSARNHCRFFAVSHVLNKPGLYSQDDIIRLGWKNHFPENEFELALASAGFEIRKSTITKNNKTKIWLCS